jgi:hypothetical protein
MGKTSVGVGIALCFAGTILGACSSSSGTGGGGTGFGSNEAGGGSGGGSGSGSGGGGGSATLNVTGTDPTSGTTTVTFTGAATNESMPGVYCKLWMGSTIQPMLEVLGNSSDHLSSAEIKAYNFDLSSGQSRQESFTSSGFTVDINATLINGSQSFRFIPLGSPMGGMCTTSIDMLTSNSVSGTFTCTPLPASGSGTPTQDTLTMDFSCPLQP